MQGRVEGTVSLKQNNVIVGKEGRIKANVYARVIEIEGQVEGDLHGDEQVIVRRSGNIRGNVVAPRVTLEDGCKFKGSIDMDIGKEAPKAEKKPEKLTDLKTPAIKSPDLKTAEIKAKNDSEAKRPASATR